MVNYVTSEGFTGGRGARGVCNPSTGATYGPGVPGPGGMNKFVPIATLPYDGTPFEQNSVELTRRSLRYHHDTRTTHVHTVTTLVQIDVWEDIVVLSSFSVSLELEPNDETNSCSTTPALQLQQSHRCSKASLQRSSIERVPIE